MKRRIFALLSCSTVACAIGYSGTAHAGSFALREQSTIGLGQAFAGASAGAAGLGSMYWNPATMTNNGGLQIGADLAVLFPYSNVTPSAGTSSTLLYLGGAGSSGDIGGDAVLPAGYVSYQVNDKLWVGFGTNTPFGLSTSYPTNYAGQIYARDSTVRSIDLNPNVAYAVTDWLSVGVGLQAMYFKTELTRAISPFPYAPSAKLEGDDWGFGFTAGATIKPFEGTQIGIGYRSSVSLTLDGDLALGGQLGPLPRGSYPIGADIDLPEQLTIGIQQAITPQLTLAGQFEWTNWSRLDNIPVVGTTGQTSGSELTSLPFHYDDGYFVSAGLDYAWNDKLTIRGGLGYEWSPITLDNRDLRLPDSNRVHASVGLSYRWSEQLTLDFAYSHIFAVGDGDISLTPGNPHYVSGLPFMADVDSRVDIVSFGLTYRFDTAKVTKLVTK